ncbi:hypothetical protein Adt_42960 [Abeliophyllum distichum]|uniref:Reverse transcriptase domain-containing protein n=1 Tax=Abeliophyllum distichum TaxID=126358 RepID=A0ABD1PVW9_9LAMI
MGSWERAQMSSTRGLVRAGSFFGRTERARSKLVLVARARVRARAGLSFYEPSRRTFLPPLDWSFLQAVFRGLGFPKKFLSWIMECVSMTSYSLSVNGSLVGFFKGKKGLRQGNSLSPFLFVLCLEYLSRLNIQTLNSDFNFHPKKWTT